MGPVVQPHDQQMRFVYFASEIDSDSRNTMQGLQSAIIELKITLIIIDSIAALARADFGAQHIIERQKLLGQQASLLKLMAESFKIPVLVTNQVTTRISRQSNEEKGILVAALGPMWAHAVNTRLSLSTVKSQEEHPRHHPQTGTYGKMLITTETCPPPHLL